MTGTRRLLGWTFVLGSLGTGAELLLLGHVESAWQTAPLGLLGAALLTYGAHALSGHPAARRAFLLTLLLCAASGIAGAVLHYRGNVEFARELDPDLAGASLVAEAMTGATPALAPGTLLLLAAVGWASSRSDT